MIWNENPAPMTFTITSYYPDLKHTHYQHIHIPYTPPDGEENQDAQ